tara:strand:+ start:320 stop:490 length:171 start_codon:yes stop_codon:yes gene_type:complete
VVVEMQIVEHQEQVVLVVELLELLILVEQQQLLQRLTLEPEVEQVEIILQVLVDLV